MAHYTKLGQLPPKRHIQFRRPDGALYSEEVFGTEGFVGPTSTLYHIHPPTQVSGWKTLYSTKVEYVEQDVMRMRHLKTAPMAPHGDPVTGRVVLFGNSDVEMSVCSPAEPMKYFFKNAMGDECLFVHFGRGTVWTMFGTLRFREKDYIVIPKGTIYKIEFEEPKPGEPEPKFVCFETANGSHIAPPPRYLSKQTSQFLEHAPYCERDLRLPELPLTFDKKGAYEVRIKARDCVHGYVYPYHPLDVVGWDGCYYPYLFNIDDFSPIAAKHHMPPPTHQTFEGHNFVICSFCPRVLDWHPQAIPVPYNHSNLDSDEVLYYVEGNYKARKGIEVGSISLHPQGIAHGPHPGTIEKSLGATYTNELAVMCDTFRPLFPTRAALDLDDPAYPASWEGEHFPMAAGLHFDDGSHRPAETTNGVHHGSGHAANGSTNGRHGTKRRATSTKGARRASSRRG
ncbi:MAG: homogentisate 1,2-dioxygenase [Phycisphaerae bacterium]|nr:homogentisate 1,2-dioxygenase [Phycisphaerae bacterium]